MKALLFKVYCYRGSDKLVWFEVEEAESETSGRGCRGPHDRRRGRVVSVPQYRRQESREAGLRVGGRLQARDQVLPGEGQLVSSPSPPPRSHEASRAALPSSHRHDPDDPIAPSSLAFP